MLSHFKPRSYIGLAAIFFVLILIGLAIYFFFVQADSSIPPIGINLIRNANFESGASNWSHGANGEGSTYGLEQGYEGQSFKMQSGSTTTWQAATQDLTTSVIQPGYYYKLTCMYKTTPDHTATIGAYIEDSSKLSYSVNGLGNNQWQSLTTNFYIPNVDSDGTSTVNRLWHVNIYGTSSNNNHDAVYYDNVSLIRFEPPTSSSEWTASPGNDAFQPTTSNTYFLDILKPQTGAKWYKVHDGQSDRWTDQNRVTMNFTAPSKIYTGQSVLTLNAWTDKPENGGTLLKEYPDSLVLYYDHSARLLSFNITASEQGQGKVLLRAVPAEGTSPDLINQIQYYSWEYNEPSTKDGITNWEYKFNNNTGSNPELLLSFAQPAIQYIKVYAHVASPLNPRTSYSTPSAKIVVQIPPENSSAPEITDGWSTNQFVASASIPGNKRFALVKDTITLFSDGHLSLPLANRDNSAGIDPELIQIDLPAGIILQANTSTTYSLNDITANADNTLQSGYHRYQLIRDRSNFWNWRNNSLILYPHFDNLDVISQTGLQMKLRAINNSEISRTDNWQSANIKCEAIPEIQLPKRLTTSYTWSTPNSFALNNGEYPNNTNFFSIYKKLGFNTVPYSSADLLSQNSPWLLTPTQRQTEAWKDLKFGPEYSPLRGGSWGLGYFTALNLTKLNSKYNLNLTESEIDNYIDNINFNETFGFNLSPEEITIEKIKWKNALHFYAKHQIVDIAYDGVFRSRDLKDMTDKANRTQPEYLFLDIEDFGSYNDWRDNIADSLNAQPHKNQGETNSELAYRLVDEFLRVLRTSISNVSPNTNVGFYDAHPAYNIGYQNFPWPLLQKNNFIGQPSVYITGRNLDGYGQLLRNSKKFMNPGSELIPWLTNGTYGELSSESIFDQTVHTFLNGATGISVFDSDYTDDMADTLSMTKAIGLLSPHEDIIMDGEIAIDDISDTTNATISAIKFNGDYLIGVTPKNKSQSVTFNVNTGVSSDYNLTNLADSSVLKFDNGVVNYNSTLSTTTVFKLSLTPQAPNLDLLINEIKPTTYSSKVLISGSKPSEVIKIMINDKEAVLDNNLNTWSGEINLITGINTINITSFNADNNSSLATRSITRKVLADSNNDQKIDDLDFTLLLYNWGSISTGNIADFNEDGKVNDSDFTLLLFWWGRN